jgi:hypothetical protein
MAIQWQSLQVQLADYFEKGSIDKNRNFEQVALQIENLYIKTVLRQGQDPFGNFLITLNKYTLASSLSRGFKESLKVNIGLPIALNGYGLSGLPSLWAGAQFSLEIPPPGSVRVINNVVVNPGTFSTMNIGGPNTMIMELMRGFQQHVKTISGITTSLVFVINTLVPVQFPWTGVI